MVVRKNKYRVEEEGSESTEPRIALHTLDAQAAESHIQKLKQVKAERDNAKVKACLDTIRSKAAGPENLMPILIDAAKAYVSIGEITDVLKEVWGSYKDPGVL